MDNNKYNSHGVATPQPLGSNSPDSNPGIVYQPANIPTNPGAFKVSQQTTKNIRWIARDSGVINIGTLDKSPATVKGSAGIQILDSKGNQVLFLGDGSPAIIEIVNSPTADTPVAPFSVNQTANPHNNTEVADFSTDVVINGHFSPMIFLSQNTLNGTSMIYLSDGTDPNGALNGVTGDICLDASGTGQISYCVSGTTWLAITGGSGAATPAGRMYLGSAQSIPTSSGTKVALDTAGITTGVTNDTSNHRITILTAGTYQISGQVAYDAPSTNKNLVTYIYINGVQSTYSIYVTNGTAIQTVQTSLLATLSVNDYVELFTFHNNGVSEALEVGSLYTYLQLFKV